MCTVSELFSLQQHWRKGRYGHRRQPQETDLARNRYLYPIHSDENNIGENGAVAIGDNLKELTYLKAGTAGHYSACNKIGEKGALAIACNLKQLTLLNLCTASQPFSRQQGHRQRSDSHRQQPQKTN